MPGHLEHSTRHSRNVSTKYIPTSRRSILGRSSNSGTSCRSVYCYLQVYVLFLAGSISYSAFFSRFLAGPFIIIGRSISYSWQVCFLVLSGLFLGLVRSVSWSCQVCSLVLAGRFLILGTSVFCSWQVFLLFLAGLFRIIVRAVSFTDWRVCFLLLAGDFLVVGGSQSGERKRRRRRGVRAGGRRVG